MALLAKFRPAFVSLILVAIPSFGSAIAKPACTGEACGDVAPVMQGGCVWMQNKATRAVKVGLKLTDTSLSLDLDAADKSKVPTGQQVGANGISMDAFKEITRCKVVLNDEAILKEAKAPFYLPAGVYDSIPHCHQVMDTLPSGDRGQALYYDPHHVGGRVEFEAKLKTSKGCVKKLSDLTSYSADYASRAVAANAGAPTSSAPGSPPAPPSSHNGDAQPNGSASHTGAASDETPGHQSPATVPTATSMSAGTQQAQPPAPPRQGGPAPAPSSTSGQRQATLPRAPVSPGLSPAPQHGAPPPQAMPPAAPSQAMAQPAKVRPGAPPLTGFWDLYVPMPNGTVARWTVVFRADGTYRFEDTSTGSVHQGIYKAANGVWSLVGAWTKAVGLAPGARIPYSDHGTYKLIAPDALELTGQAGTAVWKKVSPRP